ncbi:hypothetical protein [Bryobacter aggregatus]|nr:hypothetical protein [Bryobacter aggregatus]
MSDGREEREVIERRREQEKREDHSNRVDAIDDEYGEPERVDS